MEGITLGQISSVLAFIVGLISAIEFLFARIKKWFKTALNGEIHALKNELTENSKTEIHSIKKELKDEIMDLKLNVKNDIEPIKQELKDSRVDNLKNFIVRCLDDMDKGNSLGTTTKERLYESLDLYSNKFKQNSYVHARVEKLEKEGKL